MDQFDVNGDGVLGRGEINLWRNHFQIRDELNQDDYRFLLNTFGGLAKSNHSISYLELLNWMVKFSTYLIESNAPEPTWNKRDRMDKLFDSLDLSFHGEK